MARRGDNIHKRKDGRWEGRYKDGYRADGSVKYSSVYSHSYFECKKKLADAQSSPKSISKVQTEKLFSDLLRQSNIDTSPCFVLYSRTVFNIYSLSRNTTIIAFTRLKRKYIKILL